jgi:uncharacterized protein YecE (DUF72 family)
LIRVGPAGWSYPDWEGRVYPAHKPPGFHHLAYLSRFFDTIEINTSFYALPHPEHAERWARLVHDRPRFRFFVKLLRDFTHMSEPQNEEAEQQWKLKVSAYHAALAPLVQAKRLAGVLVQFPISFLHGKNEVRRLGRLGAAFGDLPLILEVRHESWFTPPALDTIRGLSYSLAYIDMPKAWNHPPAWHEPTGPIGYLRLHGRNSATWFRPGGERDDKYDYLYGASELEELARKARRIASLTNETAVVTNNHFAGQAVANALELQFLLTGELVPAPAELIESFPRLAAQTRVEGQRPLF